MGKQNKVEIEVRCTTRKTIWYYLIIAFPDKWLFNLIKNKPVTHGYINGKYSFTTYLKDVSGPFLDDFEPLSKVIDENIGDHFA